MADKEDFVWMMTGAGCLVGGAITAAVLRKPYWFAAGALLGAGIVGYRLVNAPNTNVSGNSVTQNVARLVAESNEQLGAPEMRPLDAERVVSSGRPVTAADVSGTYPLMHRIPDADVRINSMDRFIAPQWFGPLGPANDPVRYWA